MKHKKLFITLTAVFSVFISLCIFITIWFWGDSYNGNAEFDGFGDFRKEFKIPGVEDGACPQGMGNYKATYTVKDENGNPKLDAEGKEITDTQEYFFISAYFNGAPSRIYVVGETTGLVGYVTLKNTDGSDFYFHSGGVATNGYTLWVVSDETVYVAKNKMQPKDNIAYDIIKAAENNGELKFTATFAANCRASFCYFYNADGDSTNSSYYEDRFYIGEFYRGGNYETDKKHRLTTKSGDKNTAFVYEYRISVSNDDYGLETLSSTDVSPQTRVPRIQNIYSITDEIQGFARTKSGLVLSQSYGLKNSVLYYYDWDAITKTENRTRYVDLKYTNEEGKEISYGGFEYADAVMNNAGGAPYKDTSLYVYYIDNEKMLNKYSIPSMSEGLCLKGNRVYVLFESAAKKYRPFVRQELKNVYSFIPRTKS